MSIHTVVTADTPQANLDDAAVRATLQRIEERTRALAEVTESLRPLVTLAPQIPALVALLMDSFDDAMRVAHENGIDVERGVLNGAEAALRFGATMDAEKVRELDALLRSGVLAPDTLRVVGDLGRALTETAASPPTTLGLMGLLKALGQPDVQRALGFLMTFAGRFGRRLRELPAVQG
ncbi:MAG TPA: DUF1641 domain-containing protein [Vicinamibacterales bacterium]|nr:DUF1641 domain-containing protein [Vicinamibacterales bacterium]